MGLLISALAFFVLLSLLVLIHEFGHYIAAVRSGVTVEEFGFGLPPRAKTLFHYRKTRFSLNWIPFGGFVRLKGENAMTERERAAPGSFGAATIPRRILILIAGVLMNFLFAIVIFTFGFSFWQWVPTYVSFEQMKEAGARGEITLNPGVRIASVVPEGTAAQAQVPGQSLLLSVDGTPVFEPTDVVKAQDGKTSVTYTLRPNDGKGEETTVRVSVAEGRTGVELQYFPQVLSHKRSLPRSVLLSFREAEVVTVQTVIGIAQLFQSLAWKGRVPEGVTGIVGIAVLTHDSVQEGFMPYIRLIALLSLSLAALNILPFPALDGGRLMFLLIEAIRQRPAPRRFELMVNTIGFLLLIGLILVITYNDILRLL
jgi:regulator of sigma E protease